MLLALVFAQGRCINYHNANLANTLVSGNVNLGILKNKLGKMPDPLPFEFIPFEPGAPLEQFPN
jgi:hypothetical protein